MTKALAKNFLDCAISLGLDVVVREYSGNYVVEVYKSFAPGDVNHYTSAESNAYHAISLVPMTYPGSTWGSTSDTVGGASALARGEHYICRSGVGARFAKAVLKLVEKCHSS